MTAPASAEDEELVVVRHVVDVGVPLRTLVAVLESIADR